MPSPTLQEQFGQIDIYLFDQLLKGRISPGIRILDAGCGTGAVFCALRDLPAPSRAELILNMIVWQLVASGIGLASADHSHGLFSGPVIIAGDDHP